MQNDDCLRFEIEAAIFEQGRALRKTSADGKLLELD